MRPLGGAAASGCSRDTSFLIRRSPVRQDHADFEPNFPQRRSIAGASLFDQHHAGAPRAQAAKPHPSANHVIERLQRLTGLKSKFPLKLVSSLLFV